MAVVEWSFEPLEHVVNVGESGLLELDARGDRPLAAAAYQHDGAVHACDLLHLTDEVWIDAGIEEPFKKILIPLDGSALADDALSVAACYAKTFGSTLHLVRVVNFMYGGTFGPDGEYSPDLYQALEEGAAATVAEAAKKLGAGICTQTATLMGDPAAQLEGYVKAKDIDLIVMTTHGRGGFTRTALGSVTDRMLANGTAPVLVVRAE